MQAVSLFQQSVQGLTETEDCELTQIAFHGRLSATHSGSWSALPIGMMMYCLPSNM